MHASNPRPPIQADAETLEALRRVTGVEQVRSEDGRHPETGEPVTRPGYRLHPAGFQDERNLSVGMYTFLNGKGQTHQVPPARVDAALAEIRGKKAARPSA